MRKTVCIQGLGFVGSAMAAAVARAADPFGVRFYDVIGVDLPTEQGRKRVAAVNAGKFPFETSDATLVQAIARASEHGNLRATTDASVYGQADIVVVDVHLDIPFLDNEPKLELGAFEQAIRAIGQQMREDTLVIVETTVPPGTTEKVVVPALVDEFTRRGMDPRRLLVAHSYERVMPGKDYLDSIINFWRVYAGHTPEAGDACERFLSSIINVRDFPLTRLSSTTASETAKVLENSYRAVNISFVSEWTRYAEAVGIDLFEIVAAIRVRPTHANIRYPGLGIGGYCLTKDPTFAPAAARQLFNQNLSFPFSELAVRVASEMPHHVLERLTGLLDGSVAGKRVLLCGVSYREDVGDTRYSPSETVYRELTEAGAQVDLHDPYVAWWDELDLPVQSELQASGLYDAVMFTVPHSAYRDLDLADWIVDKQRTLVLDAFMVFTRERRLAARAKGVRIEAIGVGDGL